MKRPLLNGFAPFGLSFGFDLRRFGFDCSGFSCFLFLRLCFGCVLHLIVFGEVCLIRQGSGQFIGLLVGAGGTKVVFHKEVKERRIDIDI